MAKEDDTGWVSSVGSTAGLRCPGSLVDGWVGFAEVGGVAGLSSAMEVSVRVMSSSSSVLRL